LIATGSPFPPSNYGGRLIRIGQCNNVFIFPGVGLGIIASGSHRVTDAMFSAAARVLSEFSPALKDPDGPLFPPLEPLRDISYRVALAVGTEAIRYGLTRAMMWISNSRVFGSLLLDLFDPGTKPSTHFSLKLCLIVL